MANLSGSHGANITTDLSSFVSFQISMRSALDRQVQAAMSDIEAAYHSRVLNSPQGPGIQVSVNLNYGIRLIDNRTDLIDHLAGRSQVDMNQDMARLNLNIGDSVGEGETGQRVTEDHRGGEFVPQETARVNFAFGGSVSRIDRPATTLNPAEETGPSLQSSIQGLLSAFFVDNLEYAEVVLECTDCPICHEAFPETNFTGEGDEAIVLDCDHVIGIQCMQNWICGGHNSCPMCRAAVFRPAELAELADEEELWGRPRPMFRTAVPYVESNDRQVPLTELANQERLPLGASGPTARDWSFWGILGSDREVSEEEFRSIPRVQAQLQEIREIGQRLRAQAAEEGMRSLPRAHTHPQEMREIGDGFWA